MENPVYHVLLEGRKVGPYDRRTIVGMRVKKTLTSKSLLVAADGTQITVGELVRQGQDEGSPAPSDNAPLAGRGASYSVVQGIHAAQLLEVHGKGQEIPPFKGEIEVRVQTKVLRISGRFRVGIAWKEDRVKFPLADIAHARLRGTIVDLWVRSAAKGMQRLSLDLLTKEAAGDLAESLPYTAPYPGSEPLAARGGGGAAAIHPMLWASLLGAALIVSMVIVWFIARPR